MAFKWRRLRQVPRVVAAVSPFLEDEVYLVLLALAVVLFLSRVVVVLDYAAFQVGLYDHPLVYVMAVAKLDKRVVVSRQGRVETVRYGTRQGKVETPVFQP